MLKRFCLLCFIFSLLGCIPTIKSQLSNIKPGMTKAEVDKILEDRGKWVGNVNTEKGVHAVWGYPSDSFGPNAIFDQESLQQRHYLFFEENKFLKYSDTFRPYMSKPETVTPAGVGSPGAFGGGGMIGGGLMDLSPGGETEPSLSPSPSTPME
jgi:hypothetical protein